MGARISAIGGYVPATVIDNNVLAEWTGKTPKSIYDHTGILQRRWADEAPTSQLAYQAVLDLVRRFPDAIDQVTHIIVATSTPDRPQPPTAALLQRKLGLSGVPAWDLDAVCAGWLVGLGTAAALAETQRAKVLLVAADKYSSIVDRASTTATIFGDGASAAIIQSRPRDKCGLRSLELTTHGEYADLVTVRAGGSELPTSSDPADHLFQMVGREVKEHVLTNLPPLIKTACRHANVKLADLGALICHQANVPLLHALADKLDIDPTLVPLTAPTFGNTASASLPLTFLFAQESGLLAPGRPVALCAVGGGLTFGAGVYVP